MNEYNKKAVDFLKSTGTTLEIVEAVPQKAPLWAKEGEKHGIHYSVTLYNKKHTYTFDFWDSIKKRELQEMYQNGNDAKKYHVLKTLEIPRNDWGKYASFYSPYFGKYEAKIIEMIKPNEYDILACLSPLYEATFEDFCFSFGYDVDSRTAFKTWNALLLQDRHIRKLFSDSEITTLENIQ